MVSNFGHHGLFPPNSIWPRVTNLLPPAVRYASRTSRARAEKAAARLEMDVGDQDFKTTLFFVTTHVIHFYSAPRTDRTFEL